MTLPSSLRCRLGYERETSTARVLVLDRLFMGHAAVVLKSRPVDLLDSDTAYIPAASLRGKRGTAAALWLVWTSSSGESKINPSMYQNMR